MAEINNTGSGHWSEVDTSNTSPAPDGWPNGTYPNQVEPIMRASRGAIKRFWDRINGTVTSTGSSGTYKRERFKAFEGDIAPPTKPEIDIRKILLSKCFKA
jgi:hypothetical protein